MRLFNREPLWYILINMTKAIDNVANSRELYIYSQYIAWIENVFLLINCMTVLCACVSGFKEGAVFPALPRRLSASGRVRLYSCNAALPDRVHHDLPHPPQVPSSTTGTLIHHRYPTPHSSQVPSSTTGTLTLIHHKYPHPAIPAYLVNIKTLSSLPLFP